MEEAADIFLYVLALLLRLDVSSSIIVVNSKKIRGDLEHISHFRTTLVSIMAIRSSSFEVEHVYCLREIALADERIYKTS